MAQLHASDQALSDIATPKVHPRASRLGERLVERGRLNPQAIEAVLERQKRWGCRFGEALLADGTIRPFELAEALADGWGLPVADLTAEPPDRALCDASHIDLYLGRLFLPWRLVGGVTVVACADPTEATRRIIAQLYGPQTRIAITGKFDIIWTAERMFRERLAHDAAFRLDETLPQFSARRVTTVPQRLVFYCVGMGLLTGFLAAPDLSASLTLLLLSLFYVVNIALRLLLFCAASGTDASFQRVREEELAEIADAEFPIYTIVAPLLREAHMVPKLVAALKSLDYPAAKLDIKIVLEEGDMATMAAAKDLRLDSRFEILTVPSGHPRTKPRACNYALRFARGEYLVIYDAEDRPEPDQLKKAAISFRQAPPNVVCYQARLNVYNACDNWLTRMFALEYAAWFDFLLPGLNRLRIPIPLGGTSNHFRTAALRMAGGWDAFNVTEDADLGVRLSRRGYRVLPIDSSTYEEAIPTLRGWVRQRSRWLKGYMQTALVHFRAPFAFARAVGVWPFFGFAIFLGGAISTSLLALPFWALSVFMAWQGSESVMGAYGGAVIEVSYLSLVAGNGVLTLLAVLAPLKRRWAYLMPYGATVFFYWWLISIAAYRALWQLCWNPFYWEKTPHGFLPKRPRAAGGV